MEITKETRLESYFLAPRAKRYRMILEALEERDMTARELAYKLGFSDLNAVRPRLTELHEKGLVTAIKKTVDKQTRRSVAIFHKKREGED